MYNFKNNNMSKSEKISKFEREMCYSLPVEVTPHISNKGKTCLFVLYVQSIIKTSGKHLSSCEKYGCAKNIFNNSSVS